MLLQRGHGSILSGFLRVFSCGDVLVSLCSPFLEGFSEEVSLSAEGEGVLGSSKAPEDVWDFKSSEVWCEALPSCSEVSSFLDAS